MGSDSGGTFRKQVPPEPPSKLFFQNSSRNSDLNWWDYEWNYVSPRLELILLTFWDREVGVWGRRYFASPRLTEKRRGGLGGEIPLSPKMSAPYVTAYVSALTEYSGVGSGKPMNWGRGRSPLPRFGWGTGSPRAPFETLLAEFLAEF